MISFYARGPPLPSSRAAFAYREPSVCVAESSDDDEVEVGVPLQPPPPSQHPEDEDDADVVPLQLPLPSQHPEDEDDADDVPPLPLLPPPLRKPPTKWGPRAKFKTEAEAKAAMDAYLAALPAYKALMEARTKERRQVQAMIRQANKRKADPDRARRLLQRQRVNARPRQLSIARGICCPENVLGLNAAALENSKPFHVGVLGSCRKCEAVSCSCVERFVCTHCGAFLFPAEAKATKVRGRFNTKWEGGNLCCSQGRLSLQPIRRDATLEAIFADPLKRKFLLDYPRQFNNALALASAVAKCPLGSKPLPGGGNWCPTVLIEGKLHQYLSPLQPSDGQTERYAQLYVSDPGGQDTVTVKKRAELLHLPAKASSTVKAVCIDLLKQLAATMHNCNPFVKDFITASEIMSSCDDIPERTFVIDNAKRDPRKAHAGVYSNNGTQRTFVEVKVLCDEEPAANAIVLRHRNGPLWRTNETNRAYDALHFVLLFPCGDSGWHSYMERGKLPTPPAPHIPATSPPPAAMTVDEAAEGDDASDGDMSDVQDAGDADGDEDDDGNDGDDDDHGTNGNAPGRQHGNTGRKRDRHVAVREYHAYRLQIRARLDAGGSRMLDATGAEVLDDSLNRWGRLFQEYCCMGLAKIETQRLTWQLRNQKTLRAEKYQKVRAAVAEHDANGGATGEVMAGKRVILSSSFTGGPRNQQQRYYDSMAIVRKIAPPSLFITMTCNPKWPEIVDSLPPGHIAEDRPDIVARVFRIKCDELMDDLKKKGIFGRAVAHLHVIEFQHRGLPHAHILIILAAEHRLRDPEDIDACISAELPVEPVEPQRAAFAAGPHGDEAFAKANSEWHIAHNQWEELIELVCEHMQHGPCGKANPSAPCMQDDGTCKRKYPKPFRAETSKPDGQVYPEYRRRSTAMGGQTYKYKGKELDNSNIVPYSPYLLRKYRCHSLPPRYPCTLRSVCTHAGSSFERTREGPLVGDIGWGDYVCSPPSPTRTYALQAFSLQLPFLTQPTYHRIHLPFSPPGAEVASSYHDRRVYPTPRGTPHLTRWNGCPTHPTHPTCLRWLTAS